MFQQTPFVQGWSQHKKNQLVVLQLQTKIYILGLCTYL